MRRLSQTRWMSRVYYAQRSPARRTRGVTPMNPSPQLEWRALAWSALVAAIVIVWIVLPVGVGIFFGMLMGFALQPVYERARRRLAPRFAAVVTVLATGACIAATIGGLGYLFVTKGLVLARALLAELGPGGRASGAVSGLATRAASVGFSAEALEDRLREGAAGIASSAASIAEAIAARTASSLLQLFFAMLAMYFMFVHWPRLSTQAQAALPLCPDHTRELFAEFRRVGRTTLMGTVVTGLAQGLLAGIGYAIAGVPEPVFFGALTAVASLIPAVGTLIVWVPIGVGLLLTGHAGAGIFELVWGLALIVAGSDYVIRPRLVGGEGQTPALVTFAALFGGVEVFGLKGLILGPVLMLLSVAVLRIYGREAVNSRGVSDGSHS